MVQNTMRALPGSFSGGRSTIAEYSDRSRGIMGLGMTLLRLHAGSMSRVRGDAQSHEAVERGAVFRQIGRLAAPDDRSALQHNGVLGQFQCDVSVLLNQN